MLNKAMAAAGVLLLAGAGAAMADTAGSGTIVEPAAGTAQATPAKADASVPTMQGGQSQKTGATGGSGCGFGARTAYLGS